MAERDMFLALAKLFKVLRHQTAKGRIIGHGRCKWLLGGFPSMCKRFRGGLRSARGEEQRQQTVLKEFGQAQDVFAKNEPSGLEKA